MWTYGNLIRIEIKDTQKAKVDAENLAAAATELESVKGSIQYILNEIDQYWSQTQQDAQTFSAALRGNVQFLEGFINNTKKLSLLVSSYVESQEKTSTNVVK